MQSARSSRTGSAYPSQDDQSMRSEALFDGAFPPQQFHPLDPLGSPGTSLGPSQAHPSGPMRAWELLQAFLRSLQLLSMTLLNPWKACDEKPKIALSRRRSVAIVQLSIHVVPVLTALFLVSINFSTWYPKRPPSTTALQFLAKALELVTQASIASIVLYFVRHHALAQDALPFGALFAGLQTTSISYLWSLEFIGTLTSNWVPNRQKCAFALFIAFNVVLAAGVGPSIAITLIPQRQPFPFGTTILWFEGTENDLFPPRLEKIHIPTSCLTTTGTEVNATAYVECPWRALPTVLEMVKSRASVDLPGLLRLVNGGNIRILGETNLEGGNRSIPLALDEREGPYVSFLREHGANSEVATATTKGVMQAFFATWIQIANGPKNAMPDVFIVNSINRIMRSRSKQPIAWTQCQESLNPFDAPNTAFPGLPYSSVIDYPPIQQSSHWQLVWADVDAPDLPVSIGAIIIPPASLLSNTTVDDQKDGTSFDAFTCTISASWAPSALRISGVATLYAESNITSWPKTATQLSSEWANTVLSSWPSANNPNTTLLDIMMLPALQEDSVVQGTQTLLSGLVVAAMSQTLTPAWKLVGNPNSFAAQLQIFNNPADYVIIENGTAQNPWGVATTDAHHGLRLDTELAAEGLAYSARGIPTVIALVVLVVYSVYAVAFVTYVLAWRPESSSAWDSISELAALAILSTPTERLRHTSAGIQTLNVYREPVSIRAAEGTRLEIVFERDQRMGAVDLVQADKAY